MRMMTVRVLFFSVLKEKTGIEAVPVELPENSTGNDLLDALVARFPVVQSFRGFIRLAINQQYAQAETLLHDGDEVALITPVSGG